MGLETAKGSFTCADEISAMDRVCLVSSATAELRSYKKLAENMPLAWRKLAAETSEANVFYQDYLLLPALAHFNKNPDLHFFLFWAGKPDKSDLLGLLPVGPTRQFGRFPVPYVQNWMHHNGFLGTPLVRKGFENQFWTALFVELDAKNWPGFLHINGMTVGGPVDEALRAVCERQKRRCDLVQSSARALLQSDLEPDAYYAATVRGKKRKELRRQKNRLSELGALEFTHSQDDSGLDAWIDDFLKLECSGWKGQNGSALDCDDATREFFRESLHEAAGADELERHELRLDGKPLAMLVNFITGAGSFSFKTTFDENYSRFSPGVLLQLENLKILDHLRVEWMDSCAAEDHPMIDSLWSGRRHVGRFSIELKGLSRTAIFRTVRMGEDLMASIKGRRVIDIMEARP